MHYRRNARPPLGASWQACRIFCPRDCAFLAGEITQKPAPPPDPPGPLTRGKTGKSQHPHSRPQDARSPRADDGPFVFEHEGLRDGCVSFAGEWLNSDGTLTEDLLNELGVDTTYRTTGYGQDQQKYAFTANWYARPGLSFTGQYYWKGRQNSFNNTRASSNPDPTSGDRYPAYLTHADFATNDVNVRASWSPALLVHLVARYDYQESTIRTQEVGLAFDASAKVKTHIVSATATWNPLDR